MTETVRIATFKDGVDAGHSIVELESLRPWLEKAHAAGLTVDPSHFRLIDDELCLDGMDPDEWIAQVGGDDTEDAE